MVNRLVSFIFSLLIATGAQAQSFPGLTPTDRIWGRDTAGNGQVEMLTVGGAISFTGSGGITATGANILTQLLTVDGSGSGLDADLLDGLSSADFALATLVGDVDGAYNSNDLDEAAVESELESVLDLADLQGDLALGTKTSGNYVAEVADGTGIDGTATGEGSTYTPSFDATELTGTTTFGDGALSVVVAGDLNSGDDINVGDDINLIEAASINWDAGDCVLANSNNDLVATGCAITVASIETIDLGTDTAGNYVATVADGTGIDGTATGEGSTYTPSLDLTELNTFTLGAGSATGIIFDAGATDPAIETASGSFTIDIGGTNELVLTATALTFDGSITATGDDVTSGDDLISGDDVLLSDAGVINFNAGDCTITEGTNTLTIAGTCTLTSEVIVPDGDNTRDLGSSSATWATFHATTWEAGNAADTTVARSGAGQLTVESVAVILNDATGETNVEAFIDTLANLTSFGATDGGGTGFMDATTLGLDDNTTLRFYETEANGDNYLEFVAPAAVTSNSTCTLENDSHPIPDSCVGDGTDSSGIGGSTGSTDNSIIRADGTGGSTVQNSVLVIADTSGAISGAASGFSIEFFGSSGTDTTLTAPSAGDLNIEGNRIYRAGGTDVALADGGTGASLSDPNADRIMWWDDSDGAIELTSLIDLATEASPASGDYLVLVDAAGVIAKVDWASLPGAGGGDSITVEDGDNAGTFSATTDADFEDSGDINFVLTGNDISAQIREDVVVSGTTTTFELESTDAGAVGSILDFHHDSASPADGDIAADIRVFAGADDEEVGRIALEVDDGATTTEDTQWRFFTDVAGTSAQQMAVGQGVIIGSGTTFSGAGDLSVGSELVVGNSAPVSLPVPGGDGNLKIQSHGTDLTAGNGIVRWTDGVFAGTFTLAHSRGASVGDYTVIQNSDHLGWVCFAGSDGTNFEEGACIRSTVDGTPGNDDMPSRLSFGTTSDGASASSDRWYIRSTGTFEPASDNTYDIGTSSLGVKDIYVTNNMEMGGDTSNSLNCTSGECSIEGDKIKQAGRQTIPLLAGAGTIPSGGTIAGCSPVSAFDSGSNDVFMRQCSFSAGTDNAIYFTFFFPKATAETTDLVAQVDWTSATACDGADCSTSDDVIFTASAVCFSNDDAINGNAFPAVDTVTDTQTAAGDYLVSGEITAITPAGTPAEGDACVIRFTRDADNASDNFDGTAEAIQFRLFYVDNDSNDD